MLRPEFTGQFKRDYKLALKRGCRPEALQEVVTLLCSEEPLPEKFRDHALETTRVCGNVILSRIGCLFTKSSRSF